MGREVLKTGNRERNGLFFSHTHTLACIHTHTQILSDLVATQAGRHNPGSQSRNQDGGHARSGGGGGEKKPPSTAPGSRALPLQCSFV